ncbi:MAG TPA: YceI family protein [Gemmatimonadota bacterium]|nr:YceI family protein [Gemmatimonadota bacterium]
MSRIAPLAATVAVGWLSLSASPAAAQSAAAPGGSVSALPAGLVEYEVDPAHTQVLFKVRHMGISTVTGRFNRFAATFAYDPADPAASWLTATIDAASIDTENERRDNHLRSADFFAADSYPTLTFQSTRVGPAGEGRLEVQGNLSIRGVTRPVVLDVALEGATVGQGGRPMTGWTAETTIDRTEYGLRWNRLTEAGGWVVADEVRILLEVEARAAQP